MVHHLNMLVHLIESILVLIIEGKVILVVNQIINIIMNMPKEGLNMAKLRKIMNIPNLMNIDMEKEANLEVFHLNINIWMIMNMKWYIALFMVNKLLEEGEIMRRSINNITLSLDRIFIIK